MKPSCDHRHDRDFDLQQCRRCGEWFHCAIDSTAFKAEDCGTHVTPPQRRYPRKVTL